MLLTFQTMGKSWRGLDTSKKISSITFSPFLGKITLSVCESLVIKGFVENVYCNVPQPFVHGDLFTNMQRKEKRKVRKISCTLLVFEHKRNKFLSGSHTLKGFSSMRTFALNLHH